MIITICVVVGLVVILLGTWLWCACQISSKISEDEGKNK